MNVNTSINGFGIDGGSVFGTSKRAPEHRGGFWSALSAANAEKSGNMQIGRASCRERVYVLV